MQMQPSKPSEKMQQVRVQLVPSGQEAWIWVLPGTPCGAAQRQASQVLGQEVVRLEGPEGLLDASKALGPMEAGQVLLAHADSLDLLGEASNDAHPASRSGPGVVQGIMDFGYHQYLSEVCNFCHRFHVIIKCPKALAEATKENVIAKFEPKEFSLTICGLRHDFRLRRSFGAKTSLPVNFKVSPERCTVVVSPGKKVELILRPALPSSFRPGNRVKLQNLQSKDAVRLNGHFGTIQGFVDGDLNAVRYAVQLDDGEKLRVRPKNMVLVS